MRPPSLAFDEDQLQARSSDHACTNTSCCTCSDLACWKGKITSLTNNYDEVIDRLFDSVSCSLIPLTSPTCTKLVLSGSEIIIATFANSHR